MTAPSLKTTAYRNNLRQSLNNTGWRGCAWAAPVLAVECVQGWAGRKNSNSATMLRVYCTQYLTPHHTKVMAKFLQEAGVPPFNLVPIREYSREVAANRLPKADTQDRFWLMRGYNALDIGHWDHWSLTSSGWGLHFHPSAEEALRIIKDPIFFDTMLAQDWSRQEHFGEPSAWQALVANYHAQWPNYSAMIQLLGSMTTIEDFRSTHLSLRSSYLDPKPIELFELP